MAEAFAAAAGSICQRCGACCAYSAAWPRFTLDTEAEIAAIPASLIRDDQSGMRAERNRCAALAGEVGCSVACTIYPIRPIVCRDCRPGDDACLEARASRGLGPPEVSGE